jgi:hypothetical protein
VLIQTHIKSASQSEAGKSTIKRRSNIFMPVLPLRLIATAIG